MAWQLEVTKGSGYDIKKAVSKAGVGILIKVYFIKRFPALL